jgi:hypothetical protein
MFQERVEPCQETAEKPQVMSVRTVQDSSKYAPSPSLLPGQVISGNFSPLFHPQCILDPPGPGKPCYQINPGFRLAPEVRV